MGSYTHTLVLTSYGRKLIAEGDAVFVFASENERGRRLSARRRHVRVGLRVFSASRSNAVRRQVP
jgi:hypothetical protein